MIGRRPCQANRQMQDWHNSLRSPGRLLIPLPRRSRAFLLVSLASWSLFLLPFGLAVLSTYTPRAEVGQQRAVAAQRLGAGWLAGDPLVR